MAYLTRYGSLWGSVPATTGRVFWVAPSATYYIEGRPYSASDDNDGLSPERALVTVDRAVALTKLSAGGGPLTAATVYGDVIVLLPGTHTAAASLVLSQAGVTIMGVPHDRAQNISGTAIATSNRTRRPLATLTVVAGADIGSVTASDVTISNLRLLPVSTKKCLTFTTAASRLRVLNCYIDLATVAGNASTGGIFGTSTTQAPADIQIIGCVFKEANAGTTNGAGLSLGAAVGFLVEDCYFVKQFTASSAAWTSATVVNTNTTGLFVNNTFFAAGGGAGDVITNGVKGASLAGTSVVGLMRNVVGVKTTNPFTSFAAGDCDLALNYVATVAGGTGGTLITSTT